MRCQKNCSKVHQRTKIGNINAHMWATFHDNFKARASNRDSMNFNFILFYWFSDFYQFCAMLSIFPRFSQFCLIFSFLSRAIEDFNLVFLCLFFQLKSAVNRCNSYFIVSATFTGSAFWMLFENHGNFNICMEISNVILSHNYSK